MSRNENFDHESFIVAMQCNDSHHSNNKITVKVKPKHQLHWGFARGECKRNSDIWFECVNVSFLRFICLHYWGNVNLPLWAPHNKWTTDLIHTLLHKSSIHMKSEWDVVGFIFPHTFKMSKTISWIYNLLSVLHVSWLQLKNKRNCFLIKNKLRTLWTVKVRWPVFI